MKVALVVNDGSNAPTTAGLSEVEAHWTDADGRARVQRFAQGFRIGRDPSCEIALPLAVVSREHAACVRDAQGWMIRDLGSRNGTFVDGRRVAAERLPLGTHLRLGATGPTVTLRLHDAADAADGDAALDRPLDAALAGRGAQRRGEDRRRPAPSVLAPAAADAGTDLGAGAGTEAAPQKEAADADRAANDRAPRRHLRRHSDKLSREDIAERYFADELDPNAGEHTRMVHAVFRERKRRQTRSWLYVVGAFAVVLAVALGAVVWQWTRVEHTRQLAIDLFYSMKELQLDLARLEAAVRATGEDQLLQQLRANRQRIEAMRERYREYIRNAELIDPNLPPVDRLILDVTRVFGECELTMPDAFVAEIKAYIKKWQASNRLANAIARIQDRNDVGLVAQAMRQNGLPPHFFYIGLQESNFNPRAVGPPTRFGIAKGAWQFIPATAQDYGLRIGSRASDPVYDPADERFDFEAATWAAARFLSDIYNTDAQASGLLVMASYNWGPGNITRRIRAMPENPRERNFWALLQRHNIPRETYDYVFYIVSAAVIGENPRLFGFDFDNPLAGHY